MDATFKAFFSDTKCCAELFGQVEIFDLVLGVDVVDFANAAFVEDGVEGVGCVACVEIAARVVAFAVDVERFVTLEEIDEFGDDFWRGRGEGQSVSQLFVRRSFFPLYSSHLFLFSFGGKQKRYVLSGN